MRLLTAGFVAVGLIAAMLPSHLKRAERHPPGSIGWREITIPLVRALTVVLDTTVGSDISRVEQRMNGHLARMVRVNSAAAIPLTAQSAVL